MSGPEQAVAASCAGLTEGGARESAAVMAEKDKTEQAENDTTIAESEKRSLFRELMSGVEALREHRQKRLTLRTHEVSPIAVPPINPQLVRETREGLHMSRQVFALKLGVNPRTLERWEQGRSKPNDQAAALIWLVRKYPDTLQRLESLSIRRQA
jgi:putative transcriptional regulator